MDSEYLDEEEIAEIEVLGVDGYVVRYAHDFDYLYTWSGNSAIFVDTWKTEFDIIEVGQDLIPSTEESGATPLELPSPVPMAC